MLLLVLCCTRLQHLSQHGLDAAEQCLHQYGPQGVVGAAVDARILQKKGRGSRGSVELDYGPFKRTGTEAFAESSTGLRMAMSSQATLSLKL